MEKALEDKMKELKVNLSSLNLNAEIRELIEYNLATLVIGPNRIFYVKIGNAIRNIETGEISNLDPTEIRNAIISRTI